MYTLRNVKTKENLTKEYLLSRVSESEIFRFYLGFDYKLNTLYNSPFRRDSNPSFNLFYTSRGEIYYKDFGHSTGDCIHFVKNIFGITYYKALETIEEDLIKINNNEFREIAEKFKTDINCSKSLIQVDIQPFTKIDIEYWLKYGIKIKTLNKFKVYSVNKVWINKRLTSVYNINNPIYAYYFEFEDKLKIYLPVNKIFYTNATNDIIQGLESLDYKSNNLIITKALKDIMVIDGYNINSVAPQSENSLLSEKFIENMKKIYERIIVFYDNDQAGIKYSNIMKDKYNLENYFIPERFGVKDISDFYKQYGDKETKQLLYGL